MAVNKDNTQEKVRLDNHNNRPPHYHWDQNQIVFFEWVSWLKTRELFSQLVFKRFGDFITKINMTTTQKLNKNFIFKYDPHSNFEKILDDFQSATERKLKSVESNVLRCNNLEVLFSNMNKNRWEIFQILVNKKPNSLTELTNLVHQDYSLVKKETETLAAMGIIELQKQGQEIKPIALYKRIKFDLGISKRKKESKELSLTFKDSSPTFKNAVDKISNILHY